MNNVILAALIFVVTYVFIAIEIKPKAVVALIGASIMLLIQIISQEEGFHHIDFNVIFLLAGMMIIVNITKDTGLFRWMAIKCAHFFKGEPVNILIGLSIITAFLSAVLDNVTTVLLIAPVTIFIAKELQISAIPFLISEILASNIGGTATLIGDPPNIMIGSAAQYDFLKFLINLFPVVLVIFLVFLVLIYFLFRKQLVVSEEIKNTVANLDNSESITDVKMLKICLAVLSIVIIGFIFHGTLHLEAATIAMAGAAILLLFSDIKKSAEEVEWETIFFFIGLFILVGGIEKVGIISWMAQTTLTLTENNPQTTTIAILWLSGILSAFVDNIPYTATMIPLVKELGTHMPIEPLWWSLALGACLGGNGSLIGASANVIVADIANREGEKLDFILFLKYGSIVTLISLVISTIYLLLFYL